jgi:modification methylase
VRRIGFIQLGEDQVTDILNGESWRVVQSDCLEFLRGLPDGCVDMFFTDPPYGHRNNDGGDLIHRRECALGLTKDAEIARPIANDGAEANEVFRGFLAEAKRLLKPGAVLCCCCCGGGPDPQFARWSLWIDEVLEFKQMVVWDKGPMGMGWHYRRSYETVLIAYKKGANCRWYDESHKIENVVRHIRKVIPTEDQHPTEKPADLAAHFIRLHSLPGDLVLDPFCGSGSTGQAARNTGRRFLGIETEPGFAQMARCRIARADMNQNLFAVPDVPTPKQESLPL